MLAGGVSGSVGAADTGSGVVAAVAVAVVGSTQAAAVVAAGIEDTAVAGVHTGPDMGPSAAAAVSSSSLQWQE